MANFRAADSATSATTALSVPTPAGTAIGDLLVLAVMRDQAGTTFTPVESGWTPGPSFGTVDVTLSFFFREVTATPPASWGVTSSASGVIGRLVAIRPDSGESTPVVTATDFTAGTTPTPITPSLANTAGPRVLLAWFGSDTDYTVTVPPPGDDGTTPMAEAGAPLTNGAGSIVLASYYEVDPTDDPIVRGLQFSGSDYALALAMLVTFSEGGGGEPVIVQSEPVDTTEDERVTITARVFVHSTAIAIEDEAAAAAITVRVFSQVSAIEDESGAVSAANWSVTGIVTLAGNPVEGATVRLINTDEATYVGDTLTAADGTYAFRGLSEGVNYHVTAEFQNAGTKYNARSQPFLQATV